MSSLRVCLVLVLIGYFLSLAAFQAYAQAQYPKGYVSVEELVTISPEMSFTKAIGILNAMAKQFDRKPIVDRSGFTSPIGVPGIINVHWKKALEVILTHNNLKLETYDDYYETVISEEVVEEEKPAEAITLDTREVRISAVFFEGDRSAMEQFGIDWSVVRNLGKVGVEDGEVQIGREGTVDVTFQGGKSVSDEIMTIIGAKKISSTLDVAGMLRAVQSKNKGEVIASPQITVVDGLEGRIQIGQSVSILSRDEAGNTVSELVEAGIILTITPEIITEEEVDFIYLDLSAERSTATPAAGGVSISKTTAKTFVLLQDGDETIVGGLYTDTETKTRTGVPFLKDLPWWVFGIKFLTGYNGTMVAKKELIIVIQASIIPSIRERMEMRKASLLEARERSKQKFEQMKTELKE